MRHSHPNVQLGIDAGSHSALYIAARVLEQHFVISTMNSDARQTAQISVEKRGQRILRIGLAKIGADERGNLGLGKVQTCFRSRVEALVGKREIRNQGAKEGQF